MKKKCWRQIVFINLKFVFGPSGRTAEEKLLRKCPEHFKSDLNRVTIEGNEDYRLVLFFIKKGTKMPLHDHPNMAVYFKLMFGKQKKSRK